MPPTASAESASTRTRMPRMRSCVLGGSSGRSKNMPRSLLQNHKPLTLRIALARANDRVAQSGFGVEASRPVFQDLELFRSGPSESIAGGGEVGQAFARQHLPVVRGVVLQLARLERASRRQRQSLMAAEQIVEGSAGQIFERPARRCAAIVDPGEEINRLQRDLDHEDRGADLGRMRLDAVLELEAGQVARQQEVALDGADIDRALGGD